MISYLEYKRILQEKAQKPDYSFDRLIRKAEKSSDEIRNAISKGDEESDLLDKKYKSKATRPDKDREDQDDPEKTSPSDQDRPVPGRDHSPDHQENPRRDSDMKRAVADTKGPSKEQIWLKLANVSPEENPSSTPKNKKANQKDSEKSS